MTNRPLRLTEVAPAPSACLTGETRSLGGLQTGMVELTGLRIRVGVRAPGNGAPPLLLFNGIGANIELLEPLIAALDARVGIIVFDTPGVGHSISPRWPYRPRRIAGLARELVAHLGYARVDVLGVSWGGIMAQEFARRHGDVCRRLILAATTTGVVMVPGRLRALLGMATPRRYLDKNFLQRHVGHIYGGIFRQEPALALRYLRHVRWQSPYGYYLQLLALTGWTSVHWLHRLPQPTLVMSGDDDPITPPLNARLQMALLRNAQFWRIDCGHLFLLTRAAESARVIDDFLYQQ